MKCQRPVTIWILKLNNIDPGEYLDERLIGNSLCCRHGLERHGFESNNDVKFDSPEVCCTRAVIGLLGAQPILAGTKNTTTRWSRSLKL